MNRFKKWFTRMTALAIVGYITATMLWMPVSTFAASSVTALATNGLTSILVSPAHVSTIVFQNAIAAAATVRLYDTGSTNLTWSRSGYTNTIYYTTNKVSTYTDFAGVSVTNTNSVLVSATVTVAAATNAFRTIGTYTVPASSSLAVTLPTDGTYVSYGIAATNDVPVSATITYSSLK